MISLQFEVGSIRARRYLWLVLMMACGCTRQPPLAAHYSSDSARELLSIALTAWKSRQVKTLAQRQPPLRFADEDYRAGLQLVRFELPPADQPLQPHAGAPVELTLKNAQGSEVRKTGWYQISLTPPAVIRADP